MQSWRLDDASQTFVLAARGARLPQIIYWGASLPVQTDHDMLARAQVPDITGGMLDAVPDLSICPQTVHGFSGQPGLALRRADGTPVLPDFTHASDTLEGGKLELIYRDDANGLTYTACFVIDPGTHVITARSALDADAPVLVDWLSAPVFPASPHASEMIDFGGRWCGEFAQQRTPWSAGIRLRESRTGRTGHEHFPALIVPEPGATNTQGGAQAFHYGWSGGHRMIAEELPDGRRQIQFGHAAGTERALARHFETAPLYAAHSAQGLNGCAVAFQRHLRARIVTPAGHFDGGTRPTSQGVELMRPDPVRPVHYNCWEAVYFDHNLDVLKDIAARAADLGAERFVLDDGWFGKRDDDTTSLGDWDVDPRKYPDGLAPLIDHVRGLGMQFGIWLEPEMVNPDSDLYRAHPNWALGGADQLLGRQQMVLDMDREEVRDHLYTKIAALLAAHPIDYIKWDHNRVLPAPDAAQTRGTYALLDRLRGDFPDVEIESCASGGGRIDFGILQRAQRVWLSDSNDALERLRIQHNAALFLPMTVTGSHVGPRTCHTSGRVLDISLRAWVAAQRHMGFEMDPRELTQHEAQVLRDVTDWWKENRTWLARADILRLDSSDPAVTAEQHLCYTGARFVVFAAKTDTSAQIAPRPLRLTGLDPDAQYSITLRNKSDVPALSRGEPVLKQQPATLPGVHLMTHGLSLPWQFPGTIWVLEGRKIA